MSRHRLTAGRCAAVAALACAGAGPAAAAPGDLIRTVALPVPGNGVSVAVGCDGRVYYTNANDATLHVIDKDGNLLDSRPTVEAATSAPLQLDEMAWDGGRAVLWACEHDVNPIRVWRLDPATGQAVKAFDSSFLSVGSFRDGIAYDASDDTLWLSGDVSDVVEHYTVDGVLLGSITPLDSSGGTLGQISGVQVGLGDLLYLGQNGRAQIVRVRKSDGAFLASFASPGGVRDEGLECDTTNFAPLLALWSRDFVPPGALAVVEVEAETCSCYSCIDNLALAIPSAPSPVCAGSRITLDGSASQWCGLAGLDYRWSDSGLEICPWSTTPTCAVTVDATTTYTLEVRCRDNLQCVDDAAIEVQVASRPLAALVPLPVICPGETITLDARGSDPNGCPGPLEYRFLEGPTLLRDWDARATFGPLAPATTTTYTVEVRCAPVPACAAQTSATVTVDPGVRPGDLGNTLLHVRRGTLVEQSWAGGPGASTFVVYRHTVKGAWPPPPLRSGLAQPLNSEPDVPGPPQLYFYRVAGVSCGGLEGP